MRLTRGVGILQASSMGLSTEGLDDFDRLEPWRRDALRALRLTGSAAQPEVRVGGKQQADGRFVAALRIVYVESRQALNGIPMEQLMDLNCALDDATDVRVLGTLLGACAVGLRSFPTTIQVRVVSSCRTKWLRGCWTGAAHGPTRSSPLHSSERRLPRLYAV
jgi:hypothetical protein